MLDELWRLVLHGLREVILKGVVVFDDVVIDAYQHHVIHIHKKAFQEWNQGLRYGRIPKVRVAIPTHKVCPNCRI